MFVILLRLLLIIFILFLIYSGFKYLFNPKRKLELAHEQKQFHFLDDKENVRKNFLLTYKGVLFEGEKYLGTTTHSFEVVSIFIWAKATSSLQGLTLEDFSYVEEQIKKRYPHAKIDWKSPIKELLVKKREK
ncbi:cbb3-type cytochrome oxidase subunit 3 [Metabacillus crassostreae]|uniref:sigma-w pathway protein ysdB n=1 Tax=Metabacillus crassostreae TaxID=929098 RepID=UPI00195DAEE1|nr:sigma-w pathway protein ysdB [Metabacillus crassostreae]MBM7605681.1 cbb3-type cytochrome oxidase subunit 3 [Metabacillus crassostreae]